MSEEKAKSKNEAAIAAKELRGTATWIVGGIGVAFLAVLTSAALSKYGLLHPLSGDYRFYVATAGLIIAFIGLGLLMDLAVRVLNRDAFSFSDIAHAQYEDERGIPDRPLNPELKELRDEIDHLFIRWPCDLASFRDTFLVWGECKWNEDRILFTVADPDVSPITFDMITLEPEMGRPDKNTPPPLEQRVALLEQYKDSLKTDDIGRLFATGDQVSTKPNPDPLVDKHGKPVRCALETDLRQSLAAALDAAKFFKVKYQFRNFRKHTPWAITAIIVGLTAFAWAANPPENYGKSPSPPAKIKLEVN